jgi:arylsulfatase A
LKGRKGSLYEGGIRVPTVARWKGRIAAGARSDRVTGFEDWLPTLLDLAGIRSLVGKDVDGVSFAPTLLGKTQEPQPFLYREFPGYGGWQTARVGDWKAVRRNLHPTGRAAKPPAIQTELFNLATDPGEATDVAAQQLERIMREQHTKSALFPIPALDGE